MDDQRRDDTDGSSTAGGTSTTTGAASPDRTQVVDTSGSTTPGGDPGGQTVAHRIAAPRTPPDDEIPSRSGRDADTTGTDTTGSDATGSDAETAAHRTGGGDAETAAHPTASWGTPSWDRQAPPSAPTQHGPPHPTPPQGFAGGTPIPQQSGPWGAPPPGGDRVGPQPGADWGSPQPGGDRVGPHQPGPWGPPQGQTQQHPQYAPPWGPGAPWGPGPQTGQQQAPWAQPGPAADPARTRRRRLLVIGAIAAVVIIVLAVAGVLLVSSALTRQAVAQASGDVRTWTGVTYRGQVDDGLGGPASVEMTVDAQGNAAGTITRASGGRADFVVTPSTEAIRGDEQYWSRSAPRPRLATKLAGVWVSGATEQLAPVSGWALSPGALATALADRPWSEEDSRQVGPAQADVLSEGPDRMSVDDSGERARLVEVELDEFGRQRTTPVTTEQASPQSLGTVTATTGQLASMPSLRSVIASTPLVLPTIDPIPDCFTPSCNVTFRVTNNGRYRSTGTLNTLVNGAPLQTFSFDVAPGGVQVFTATVENPAVTARTSQASAQIGARVVDVE